jgi:hypothetical protein
VLNEGRKLGNSTMYKILYIEKKEERGESLSPNGLGEG